MLLTLLSSIRKGVLLWPYITLFLFWPASVQASFLGDLPGSEGDSIAGLGLPGPGIRDDRFRIVDQLESVGIDDDSFFDFAEEREPGPGAFEVEVYAGGDKAPRLIYGFDRGIRFDSGIKFDEGSRFDKGATFDRGEGIDTGGGFDAVGGFDKERLLRIEDERLRPSLSFRREASPPLPTEGEDRLVARTEGGSRFETPLSGKESGEDALTKERENLEEELLRSEELGLRSFKPSQTAFFVKAGMFAMALLLVLAGTLKGLIPFRFYFFLTILILILWSPIESLFISIIIALSALLAPLVG